MKLEDIKVGETYNVRVKVVGFGKEFDGSKYVKTIAFGEANDLDILATPSKYDPCRKLREGDKVRLVEWNGRDIIAVNWICETNITKLKDDIFTVSEDEHLGYVKLEEMTMDQEISLDVLIPVCFLELVTPVEEIEPYSVHETDYLYRVIQSVDGGEQVVCEYRKNTHPNAKEAAQAECARLNAEYRKEQEWKSNKQDN